MLVDTNRPLPNRLLVKVGDHVECEVKFLVLGLPNGCFRCKQAGHYIRDCPYKPALKKNGARNQSSRNRTKADEEVKVQEATKVTPPSFEQEQRTTKGLPDQGDANTNGTGGPEPEWQQVKSKKGKAKREARNKGINQDTEDNHPEASAEVEGGGLVPCQGKRPLEENSPPATPKAPCEDEWAGPSSPPKLTFGEYYSKALTLHGERLGGGENNPIIRQTMKKQRQYSPGKSFLEEQGPIGTPRRLRLGWEPPCSFPPG